MSLAEQEGDFEISVGRNSIEIRGTKHAPIEFSHTNSTRSWALNHLVCEKNRDMI